MWGKYELLRPSQIEAIRAEAPIAYIPWGALEWHSYHNPIGLDGLKARALCEALAEQTGGVVLPPVYAGTDTIKPFKGFYHTIEHAESTVQTLCREYMAGLVDEGFKVIILLTGHYGREHVRALKETTEQFASENPQVRVWTLTDYEPHEGHFEGNHAAKGETSYMMLYYPDSVDLSLLPADRRTTLDDDGVMGLDPREASAEHGQEELEVLVQNTVPKIRQLLESVQ
ncbi:MAG: creatininase family protein [Anaerolineae bacterium]|nr:creatininase family protein [Anaerolineae bacterium]